ncbi:MAG: long-chain fatty acid--CoA ligase [Bacteroidetes bacterium]|nr:long-chain fatty acid--CoA ligase [Bacteroidota bacterium]
MSNTLPEMFFDYVRKFDPEKEIFFTKLDDDYIPFSLNEFVKDVYKVINYFRANGINKGDRISIISENRKEWAVVDFACIFMNIISVPVYTSLSAEQTEYILRDSSAKVCFVSGSFLLEKVLSRIEDLPELKNMVVFNDINPDNYNRNIKLFSDIIDSGINNSFKEIIDSLDVLSSHIKNRDLVTIIYTSGTTGNPKGVMLSHKNLSSNLLACRKVLTINESDRFLSYLPYSHAYERLAGYYLAFFSGAQIYFAQSIETLSVQMREVRPTIIITVPRLLDKLYSRIMKSPEDLSSGIQKKIFLAAISTAKDGSISKKSLRWKLADKLVYRKIREKTGGALRFLVSGGGALNKNIGEFFERIGLTVLEGYGMTETSPVISVNSPGSNKYGTVGKPLQGVQLRFTSENEITVKGDLVMEGYYMDPASTSETIKDGWLYTGDIGEMDSDGFLKITDRKKSLFKSSGGKYVSPTHIEEIVSHIDYIENVMVIGNERLFVTALIVPVKNELIKFAKDNGIIHDSFRELVRDKNLIKLIKRDIDSAQSALSNYERIRKFILTERSFAVESGELTPTMKIKRAFVEKLYKDEIDEMYK